MEVEGNILPEARNECQRLLDRLRCRNVRLLHFYSPSKMTQISNIILYIYILTLTDFQDSIGVCLAADVRELRDQVSRRSPVMISDRY